MGFYVSGVELHTFTVLDLLDIIIKVEEFSFGENERAFVEKYDRYSDLWSLVHSRLTEGFAAKLVANKDVEGLKNLLNYFLGLQHTKTRLLTFSAKRRNPTIKTNQTYRSITSRSYCTATAKTLWNCLA